MQIGLFAQGGRQVRCVRCRHEWRASLPVHIDVYMPPPDLTPEPPPYEPAANLPAVTKARPFAFLFTDKTKKLAQHTAKIAFFAALIILSFVALRGVIVRFDPHLITLYRAADIDVARARPKLAFEQVSSNIKYDGGTMHLFVDGVIRNTTSREQQVPDIKAMALGPDGSVIQSWQVSSPATTIEANGAVSFHTGINTPMNQTIENVRLEFVAQGKAGDGGS
ncbi:MAG: hypothetical protein KGI37_10270 [Alphaproteobacteria bacterium]|nr:hypothetical protein [Alphaproteobacteria bacterium]